MATTKKKTELIVDDETTANVIETIDKDGTSTKRVSYPVKIKQNEIVEETTSDLENAETDFDVSETFVSREVEEIPKDKIDSFFDDIESALNNEHESFYIRVVRIPDGFDDYFINRCNDTMPLGMFASYMRDKFRLAELIQKRNNNSGGRFNLIAYDKNQQPLQLFVGYEFEQGRRIPQMSSIVARDVIIPNPLVEQQAQATNENSLANVLRELGQMQQQNTQLILQAIKENNQPKEHEKSSLEIAIEQKIINDIVNPKANNNSFEEKMMSIFAMPVMVEKMAKKMFPDEQTTGVNPADLSTFDKILGNEFLVSKGMELIGGIVNLSANLAAMKLAPQQPNPQPTEAQPQVVTTQPQQIQEKQVNQIQATQQQANEANQLMQEIFGKIINELESENSLNGDNNTLKQLTAEYPQVYPFLVNSVKSMTFDECFDTLLQLVPDELTAKYFNPLIPDELNDAGLRIEKRLQELYDYWKSN